MNSSTTAYVTTSPKWEGKLVSDSVFQTFEVVVYIFLIGLVGLFGMLSNILNIIVFVRMGVMSESSHVSLLGLAISDLGGVSFIVNFSILMSVEKLDLDDDSWSPSDVMNIYAGWPHIMFAQMTCCITAYIAFERCMCVVFPFKVKTWFSPKSSLKVVSGIFLYFIIAHVPIFSTKTLQWKTTITTNTSYSKLTMVIDEHHNMIRTVISYYINIFIVTTVCMIIVIVSTKITIYRVIASSSWRETATTSAVHKNTDSPSGNRTAAGNVPSSQTSSSSASIKKEMKLIKMITVICTIFIVCNIPGVINPYVRRIYPELNNYGIYRNLFQIMYGYSFFMECINSSINILVYYKLSTRYRQMFKQTFFPWNKKIMA